MLTKRISAIALLFLAVSAVQADATGDIEKLQHQWEIVKYRTPEKLQQDAYEQLAKSAEEVVQANPGNAGVLIWQGIILSSYAGAKGGLGALSLVKQARNALEQAIKIDPNALAGSAYTTLGSIYYQVPGWPLGFGDDDKARDYLAKALDINPDGIDTNFWYASFLVDQHQYKEALSYLQKARQAPPRSGRELADQGRRAEIDTLIHEIERKLNI